MSLQQQSTIATVAVTNFDESSRRYHCCCGCIHVKTGAFFIGCLNAIGLLSTTYQQSNNISSIRKSDYKSGSLIYISPVVSCIFFVANILAVVFLFFAICKQIPKYLKPMLVVLALSALFSGLTVLILILGLTMDSEYLTEFMRIRLRTKGADPQKIPSKRELTGAAILAIFVYFLSMLIQIWWYNVVKACHVYLQEKSVWYSYHPSIGQSVTYGGADVSSRPLVRNFPSGQLPQQQPQTTVAPQQPWHATGGGQNTDDELNFGHPPPPYSEAIKQGKV